MPSECGVSTMPHCLEWYKLEPRARLLTLPVRHLVGLHVLLWWATNCALLRDVWAQLSDHHNSPRGN